LDPAKCCTFTLLYFTVLYSTVLYSTVLYPTGLYSPVFCSNVLYFTVLYSTVLYPTVLYSTVLYSAVLYPTVLYFSGLYSTVLYFTLLYFTLLYFLYCTFLYCTLPYCTLLYGRSTPVSGISESSATLGQVTLPLLAGGQPMTYMADVLGGEGSLCPALVGPPSTTCEMGAAITNWFENGDRILLVGSKDKEVKHYQMFRILLKLLKQTVVTTCFQRTMTTRQRLLDKPKEMWCYFVPR